MLTVHAIHAGGVDRKETVEEEVNRRLKFLASTKFIACLGQAAFFHVFPLLKKHVLHEGMHIHVESVVLIVTRLLVPHTTGEALFHAGQPSSLGMYIVSRGELASFEEVCRL